MILGPADFCALCLGCIGRHDRRRSACSGPQKYSRFSGLPNRRPCLSALLALRHSAFAQKRCVERDSGIYDEPLSAMGADPRRGSVLFN